MMQDSVLPWRQMPDLRVKLEADPPVTSLHDAVRRSGTIESALGTS